MATRSIVCSSEGLLKSLFRFRNHSCFMQRVAEYSQQTSNQKNISENAKLDEPVPFTDSKAADWKSEDSDAGKYRTNRPDLEPLIVKVSLAVFMIYFFFLREESDWDIGISDEIYSKVPDLEIVMLRQKRKNANRAGADPFTEADRARLQELEEETGIAKK